MIKTNNGDEFKSIHLRLGGFHQLMSFLGTIGKLYEGSGIENVWESVYAKKSIPKMLTGKAYSKCLRACLLTDVALHAALLQSNSQENQDDDCINQYENACDSEDFNIIEPMMFRESDDGNIFSNTNDWFEENEEETAQEEVDPDQGIIDERYQSMPTKLLKESVDLCNRLLSKEITVDDESVSDISEQLYFSMENLKKEKLSSRTARFWMMFMNMVSIMRVFIRGERTGSWDLHLKASESRLPYFASAGHNNYTRCARLYLQSCSAMCECMQKAMSRGLFTIHRNSSLFWSGTWTDMAIEQSLMRAGKSRSDIMNQRDLNGCSRPIY